MTRFGTGIWRTALRLTAVGLCAGASFVGIAAAQSLKEMRARESEDSALAREAAYTNSICGSSLTASIDWRSVANWPAHVSLADSCDGALGALEAICRSGEGKARAKRVTRFVCAGDGSGASLRGGTLRYGASPGVSGFAETKSVLDSGL